MKAATIVGRWFTAKYRKMLAERGAAYTMRRMQKDGVHRLIVRVILTGEI